MSAGNTGEVVSYTLLQKHANSWVNVDGYEFATIGQAVAMLEDYQAEEPGATFAVGKVVLAMISRPKDGVW